MKYDLILVRYGEIALKGKEVRRRFEDTLIQNIKNAFFKEKIESKINKEYGRIFIFTSQIDKSLIILKKIFGINSISPVFKTISTLEKISDLAQIVAKENIDKNKSFAIRASRTGNHSFTSQKVAEFVGSNIVKSTNASVNLTNPDFELFIEVRNKDCYIFTEKIRCAGGMPVGSQGKVLALIENTDSILAAWYMVHRGCKLVLLNTSKKNDDIIESFTNNWLLNPDIFKINSSEDLFLKINDISKQLECKALVTGHSLINTSLEEIKEFKKHINLPILFPIIAMDKDEIKKNSKGIGLNK